jgi:hypothetical protein
MFRLSLEEAAGFTRDAFGRQSMSEKRHATLDAKHTDTYQRNKKLRLVCIGLILCMHLLVLNCCYWYRPQGSHEHNLLSILKVLFYFKTHDMFQLKSLSGVSSITLLFAT